MNISRISCLIGLLLFFPAVPALAWRCDQGLVDVGEAAAAVRQKCGPPDFVYPGHSSRRHPRAADERWYYNRGPGQLLRVLHFHAGVLADVDTAGYGFTATRRHCTPADIRAGMSVYELEAMCGKPRNKRVHTLRSGGGKHARSLAAASRTEIWTYDFGSQYLLQKVTIADGQVRAVETASRSQRRSQQNH